MPPNCPGAINGRFLRRCSQRERLGLPGRQRQRPSPRQAGRLPRLFGAFARLEKPIDFESLDGEPVDLIFLPARAGSGRCRSSEGAGARRAHAARSGHGRETARNPRRGHDSRALTATSTSDAA